MPRQAVSSGEGEEAKAGQGTDLSPGCGALVVERRAGREGEKRVNLGREGQASKSRAVLRSRKATKGPSRSDSQSRSSAKLAG
jgi:hypothetical protein